MVDAEHADAYPNEQLHPSTNEHDDNWDDESQVPPTVSVNDTEDGSRNLALTPTERSWHDMSQDATNRRQQDSLMVDESKLVFALSEKEDDSHDAQSGDPYDSDEFENDDDF